MEMLACVILRFSFYVCVYMVKKNMLNDNKNKNMINNKNLYKIISFICDGMIYVFCIRQDVKIPLKIVCIYEITLK